MATFTVRLPMRSGAARALLLDFLLVELACRLSREKLDQPDEARVGIALWREAQLRSLDEQRLEQLFALARHSRGSRLACFPAHTRQNLRRCGDKQLKSRWNIRRYR